MSLDLWGWFCGAGFVLASGKGLVFCFRLPRPELDLPHTLHKGFYIGFRPLNSFSPNSGKPWGLSTDSFGGGSGLESGSSKIPQVGAGLVQGWCRPGVRFRKGSGGSGVVLCRRGEKFQEGSGRSGVVWRRPGVRFKESPEVVGGLVIRRFKEGSGVTGVGGIGIVRGGSEEGSAGFCEGSEERFRRVPRE